MWQGNRPVLERNFFVVRDQVHLDGDSDKPATTADHAPYAKRAMAGDQVALMAKLGFERFFVAGHDRGGRVGYRLALDHPQRVLKLAVLDILIPTGEIWRCAGGGNLGLGAWHWYFHGAALLISWER